MECQLVYLILCLERGIAPILCPTFIYHWLVFSTINLTSKEENMLELRNQPLQEPQTHYLLQKFCFLITLLLTRFQYR